MFGESDSESPRVPSPWDSLTSSPPTPPRPEETLAHGIPRLVPEAEEGNIEYKLQLLSPSPARFTRLVTQLKWRLLEGGGQAYYEIGVADSGTLIGLPRQELEESLETLEMMAGEIGASVIVVKEIEVPPELSGLSESQIDRWDGRRMGRRKDFLRMMNDDSSPSTSTTEFETELSTTDVTDVEEKDTDPLATSPESRDGIHTLHTALRPSPTPLPFNPALAIFTMDTDSDIADYADTEAPDVGSESVTAFSVNLEIASVYKPRPMRKRTTHVASAALTHFDKRGQYMKKKGSKHGQSLPKPVDTTTVSAEPDGEPGAQSNQAKAQIRKDKRDKRRELKRNALLTHVPTSRPVDPTHYPTLATDDAASLVSGLEFLHVTVEPLNRGAPDPPEVASPVDNKDVEGTEADAERGARRAAIIASNEPRLIVEALVVRKLSLDEAFLDFGGFSLH